ncbi:PrsW family glutamic-type intramembrane protease [Butyrivibrio sp. INlla16]|uniref:PrsW family glutamic-type intramembrane protease n=1 Tax=Butyrivibrio sp. INlla16 TaxID=1520807 RepID=UPI00088CDA53|nr:PrsW family glutamic-type intramembrane protease [Butyrivibrio sp. INlla16]SDB52995.1 Membrane proteinase PrsW, cleaves anti-sigma factor RsiW, M82 family [Butyrivibrio sp. INlla16]
MIYPENILICIAVPLVITAFFVKGSARKIVASFVIGMLLCLVSAYIGGFLEMSLAMDAEETSIFISPITEEIIKFMPVLFAMLLFDSEDEELRLIAVGTGAGFSTFENCCHIISGGSGSLVYVLIRGFAAGVMHVVSIYALSLALVALRRYKAATFPVVVGALSISVSFHALYNLLVSEPGISSYIGYILPLGAAIVLLLFFASEIFFFLEG